MNLKGVEKNMNREIFVEIYSTQFSSEDPVIMEDVTSDDEILSMIEAIPIEDYMMLDLYIDVVDTTDFAYQESFSIQGCRDLEKLKKFVINIWNKCIVGEQCGTS
jgi:hypothetical protein